MSIAPDFLDELRARTSLTTLIGGKVALKKAGRESKGCCPFHGEKTPSFYVNDEKGFYHCFGCSAHGDAIRWMTDHEGMPFLEAVRDLADKAGLEMPRHDPKSAERDVEQRDMLQVMDRAARWYAAKLAGDQGQGARAYLEQRGITPAIASDFGIGWSPGGRNNPETLIEHLKDVAIERLVKLGLAKLNQDDGSSFDFFRHRIMFPIRDARGRVIGFGGRVIGKAEPKYLNSPDTPVFDKGRTLFNVDRAGPASRAAKRLIVVEGYMDVIGLAIADVSETIAPNGTALTAEQIAYLWRLADVPIICLDGDAAGRAAAARAAIRALPLLEPGKSLSFVTPPEGQDPDDVVRLGGRAAVEGMLAIPMPLADLLWRHERDAELADTPEQVAGLKKRLRDHVRSIRNADVREAYGQDMARRFRQTFDAVSEGVAAAPRRAAISPSKPTERQQFSRRATPQTAASRAIGRTGMAQSVERAVLAGLLRYPDVAGDIEAASGARFSHPAATALLDALIDAALEHRDFVLPDHLEHAAAFARSGPLRFSFTTEGADPEVAKNDLVEALYQLSR